MRRVLSALSLVVVIAVTLAAMSWNRARIAPMPEPGGDLEVDVQHAGWADLYVPAGHAPVPTLFFSPGLGVGGGAYKTFLTDIASHGFLVVAVPYPPVTIEDNSQFLGALPKISGSVSAALDRMLARSDSLRARVDTSRIAAIGHSFGGGAAALTCTDRRFKAAVDFDGSLYGQVVHEGVACPFLLVQQSLSRIDTADRPIFYEERSQGRLHEDSLIAHSPIVEWVTMDGLDHMSFTDPGLAFVSSNWIKETARMRFNAARSQRVTADLAIDFLRRRLAVKPTGPASEPLPRGLHRVTK